MDTPRPAVSVTELRVFQGQKKVQCRAQQVKTEPGLRRQVAKIATVPHIPVTGVNSVPALKQLQLSS